MSKTTWTPPEPWKISRSLITLKYHIYRNTADKRIEWMLTPGGRERTFKTADAARAAIAEASVTCPDCMGIMDPAGIEYCAGCDGSGFAPPKSADAKTDE